MGSENAPPGLKEIGKAVDALPLTSVVQPLDHRAALAALFLVKDSDPNLHDNVRQQLRDTATGILGELEDCRSEDGSYQLSADELRGALARSAISGAAVVIASTGAALGEIRSLQAMTEDVHANGPSPDGPSTIPPIESV